MKNGFLKKSKRAGSLAAAVLLGTAELSGATVYAAETQTDTTSALSDTAIDTQELQLQQQEALNDLQNSIMDIFEQYYELGITNHTYEETDLVEEWEDDAISSVTGAGSTVNGAVEALIDGIAAGDSLEEIKDNIFENGGSWISDDVSDYLGEKIVGSSVMSILGIVKSLTGEDRQLLYLVTQLEERIENDYFACFYEVLALEEWDDTLYYRCCRKANELQYILQEIEDYTGEETGAGIWRDLAEQTDLELELPYYYYDFAYAKSASTQTKVRDTIMGKVLGSSLFGSFLADGVSEELAEEDTVPIEALCAFNQTMEEYIDSHAGALDAINDSFAYGKEASKTNNIDSLADTTQIDMQELLPVYVASGLIAAAYRTVIIDECGSEEWSDFEQECYELLMQQYSDEEITDMICGTYTQELLPAYEAYLEVVDAKCTDEHISNGFTTLMNTAFVMGEGKKLLQHYCTRNDARVMQHQYGIRIMNINRDTLYFIALDTDEDVNAVSDETNGQTYYFYKGNPVGDTTGRGTQVYEFGCWAAKQREYNARVDNDEYIAAVACFEE